ncbi:hypothetical protein SAMN05216238_11095 [Lentibacillus persicus]|uniref:S1 motif domain-containing protein n=1 Tax=Lentibacillus persicus TaxID=640948 RepID=A0A1I1YTK5_9BACI|nr:S1-like domain-containing RNA-binding protein [Lentibacillus persicus]SFE22672.1 hypothetical protein SAMN05216238_11095 [Lentibacillus persicus]
MKLGAIQTMKIIRETKSGYMLQNDVFLPKEAADADFSEGQKAEVFLYNNRKGNVFATTNLPAVQVDVYDWVEVVEAVSGLGVFVDIGIETEVLVSQEDLPPIESVWPAKGDMLLVNLDTDKKGRLIAVPAGEHLIRKHWQIAPSDLLHQSIGGRVYHTSKEGSALISEDGYRGFIHHTERKHEPRLGEWVEGRVIDVKDDGTLNVSLRPLKQDSMHEDAKTILKYLEVNDGVMHFSDKSDPEDIRGTFNISKAAFKRALGKLMKDGHVKQEDGKTFRM